MDNHAENEIIEVVAPEAEAVSPDVYQDGAAGLEIILSKLEAQRKEPNLITKFINFISTNGVDKTTKSIFHAILDYPLPENREALLDLFAYCAKNLDSSIVITSDFSQTGLDQSEYNRRFAIASAWKFKLEKIYETAFKRYGVSADYDDFRAIFEAKNEELNEQTVQLGKRKDSYVRFIVIFVVVWVAWLFISRFVGN